MGGSITYRACTREHVPLIREAIVRQHLRKRRLCDEIDKEINRLKRMAPLGSCDDL